VVDIGTLYCANVHGPVRAQGPARGVTIQLSVFAVVVGAALLAALLRAISRLRVDDRDVAWIAASVDVPSDEAAVYRRYLTRHRRHRAIGGAFGVAFAVVVGIRWSDGVRAGIGSRTPFADVILCGVTGVLVGALSAESYRLGRRSTGATASLAPRDPLPGRGRDRAAEGIIVAAGASGLAAWTVAGTAAPFAMACVGGLVVGIARATRRAIASRPRPVLGRRAAEVDGRIRWFAGESVSWLELGAAVLFATWVLALFPRTTGVVESTREVLSVGGFVSALLLVHRAVPRPPRDWVVGDPVGGPVAGLLGEAGAAA
jgi:hypothetical protein